MSPELFWSLVGLTLLGALIVVVNDWTKRRAVRNAEARGLKPRAKDQENRTNWQYLAFIVAGVIFFFFVASKGWMNDYHGPFENTVRELFDTELD
jgi:hypothetical protein